jgi:urease accessory protein
MQEAHEIVNQGEASLVLELPFESRQKCRLRATLDNGDPIGLFMPRGTILRHGMLLKTNSGALIQIKAAKEAVSTVCSDDAHLLTRVSYHLGNRHVPLQIEKDFVRYQHDHVLDEMVRGLGAEVRFEQAEFEPEAGAYGQAQHTHSHTGHEHEPFRAP